MATRAEVEHNIERMEELGRYNYERLCQIYDPSIKCVRTNITDSWDIEQTGSKGEFIVEIKVRGYRVKEFVDLYVDKIKIDALRKGAIERGCAPIVTCFYPKDNEAVMWNVFKEYELTNKLVNKCTAASRKEKVPKDVFSLLLSDGKHLEYNFVWEENRNDTVTC